MIAVKGNRYQALAEFGLAPRLGRGYTCSNRVCLTLDNNQGVAQSGSAQYLEYWGRLFKSNRSD